MPKQTKYRLIYRITVIKFSYFDTKKTISIPYNFFLLLCVFGRKAILALYITILMEKI